jgi:hypothetical protein
VMQFRGVFSFCDVRGYGVCFSRPKTMKVVLRTAEVHDTEHITCEFGVHYHS